MKSILLSILLITSCLCCNKDETLKPSLQIKPIVGIWKLSEIQIIDGRDKRWQQVPYYKENDIEVRSDGVFLDYKGQKLCCHPKELKINNSLEQVNNYIKIRDNATCSTSCVSCQVWTIESREGEMILTGCLETDVKKYIR